jgi:hypothetical protein
VEKVEKKTGETQREYLGRIYRENNLQQYDVLVLTEPEVSWLAMEKEFPYRISLHEVLCPGRSYAFTGIIASRDAWDQNSGELCRRFVKAVRNATLAIYALPELPFPEPIVGQTNDYTPGKEDSRRPAAVRDDHRAWEQWERVLEAVRAFSLAAYPEEYNSKITDEALAWIINGLRRQEYFARSTSFCEKRAGLALGEAAGIAGKARTGDSQCAVRIASVVKIAETELGVSW